MQGQVGCRRIGSVAAWGTPRAGRDRIKVSAALTSCSFPFRREGVSSVYHQIRLAVNHDAEPGTDVWLYGL
jgi:hypothetical protein